MADGPDSKAESTADAPDAPASEAQLPDAPASEAPAARPSPAAAAASRARRIGGRSTPPPATGAPGTPREAADSHTAGTSAATKSPGSTKSVSTTKTTSTTKSTSTPARASKATSAAEPDAAGDERARGWLPRTLQWTPPAVLAAGAVAMLIVFAIASHGVWWGRSLASGPTAKTTNTIREQVTAAAKSCLAISNTYKYTDIDTFEKNGSACTTGAFTNQFRTAVNTLIKKNAPKLKFAQTAQINKAGIESVTNGQWTILLFGQLAVTNVNSPTGRTDPFAALVRMEKAHGNWLIASERMISSPVPG